MAIGCTIADGDPGGAAMRAGPQPEPAGLGALDGATSAGALAGLAGRDPLTGLAGRGALHELALSAGRCSVIVLELDQLTAVNNTYGHHSGDRVLRELGARLGAVAGAHPLLRLGSDEFAIIVDSAERADCEALARSAYAAIGEPIDLDSGRVYMDAGVGIALAEDELSLWDLVSRAGASIRPLKYTGRLPRIVVYDELLHGEVLDTMALSLDLRAALIREQLLLHYQPLVDMTTRRALGFEALARWRHPTRGVIAPTRFIPLAERAGLMPELGEWVLTNACRAARCWDGRPGEPPYVSVNISVRQLEDPDFLVRFGRALQSSGLEPSRLRLELTESVLAASFASLAPLLDAVREMGVRVLLDDFGTGYSSLSYLRELPLDGVKLDRAFTRDLTVSAGAWSLARAAATMIGQLGLEMIAEGLETAAHLAQLRSLGCHVGQGFYFARPGPGETLRFEQLGRVQP